jgi:hypothetical protein
MARRAVVQDKFAHARVDHHRRNRGRRVRALRLLRLLQRHALKA